ncbi:hypothetical protein BaRGS_00038899, partial [Batillaria attramentaria]
RDDSNQRRTLDFVFPSWKGLALNPQKTARSSSKKVQRWTVNAKPLVMPINPYCHGRVTLTQLVW